MPNALARCDTCEQPFVFRVRVDCNGQPYEPPSICRACDHYAAAELYERAARRHRKQGDAQRAATKRAVARHRGEG